MFMFRKKEQRSVVQRLKEELGAGFERTYMGIMLGDSVLGKDTQGCREDFTEVLEPFIEKKLEGDYQECSECGCLVAKDKALMVETRVINNIYDEEVEKHYYCKHCKPPYDEILEEWDEKEEKKVVVGYVKNGVKCDESGKILK